MKNKLTDLQNHLFEVIERLNDDSLKGDALNEEIKRALALNEIAKTAVSNGALMVKAVDTLYGLPVSDELPLIPRSPSETPMIREGKNSRFIEAPKMMRRG
jgi:hypothetical protein